jgi:small subunit ribosomal protein S20
MANTSSSRKATRKIARRSAVNRDRKSRMKTYVRKVEEAIASGDGKAATAALTAAQPVVMRSASKGVLHKNAASRKIARLAARVKKLGG